MDKTNVFKKAEKKARRKKRAVLALFIWAMFIPFFTFLDINDGGGLDWAFFPIFGWGVGVFILVVRAFDYFGFGEKWEKEELKKEIAKRKKVLMEFEEEYGDLDELDLEDLREIRRVSNDKDFV